MVGRPLGTICVVVGARYVASLLALVNTAFIACVARAAAACRGAGVARIALPWYFIVISSYTYCILQH